MHRIVFLSGKAMLRRIFGKSPAGSSRRYRAFTARMKKKAAPALPARLKGTWEVSVPKECFQLTKAQRPIGIGR